MDKPQILIIGGTSGIGLALAQAHDQLGWHIHIVGSSEHKINTLRSQYPHWHIHPCDLRHRIQRDELFQTLTQYAPYQRIIYAAGWYLNERRFQLNATDSQTMLAINLQAFHHSFEWASQQLQSRPTLTASLVCLSSAAGLIDYPYTSVYAQCKRAMWHTAAAYRAALTSQNIHVLAVASGYVDTAKLRELNGGNAAHKPFLISEQQAVAEILNALNTQQPTAIFPKRMKYLTTLLNHLPQPIVGWLIHRTADKNTQKSA